MKDFDLEVANRLDLPKKACAYLVGDEIQRCKKPEGHAGPHQPEGERPVTSTSALTPGGFSQPPTSPERGLQMAVAELRCAAVDLRTLGCNCPPTRSGHGRNCPGNKAAGRYERTAKHLEQVLQRMQRKAS